MQLNRPLLVTARLILLATTALLSTASVLSGQSREFARASAGIRIAPGDTPLNLIETPGGVLVSTNSPYRSPYLLAYNEVQHTVVDKLQLPALWYGLDYQVSHKLLLAAAGSHSVWAIPFANGVFGKPREIVLPPCDVTAGVAVDSDRTALVSCNESHQIVRFDLISGNILGTVKTGEYPYAIRRISSGLFAVANWGQASVSILRVAGLKVLATIPVGSHPADLRMLTHSGPLLVACSDSDLISIIDIHTWKEIRRVDVRIPGLPLGGAQLSSLTIDRIGHRLFAALAAVNAVAVFNIAKDDDSPESTFNLEGLIPVGAYPSSILYSTRNQALYIADGRNLVLGPSSPKIPDYLNHPGQRPFPSDSGAKLDYVGYLRGGSLEMIDCANLQQQRTRMLTLAQQIYGIKPHEIPPHTQEMVRYFSAKINPNRPIQHVIYVMKENRTYDQILGDMPEGNGDPSLTLFGENITPNEHALARQFVLFDNFYVDGDVSWNGHLWSMAGQSTDFVERFWPATYGNYVKFYLWGSVLRGDATHDHPVAVPASGFLWDAAHKANITYRDYGIWCVSDDKNPKRSRAWVRNLVGHYDPLYDPDLFDDQGHINEWEREFHGMVRTGNMPALTLLYLGSDHTVGTRPGGNTPRALVASNDLAVGRLIDDVSHSPFWASTAIFILEDDSQDGPDHVDCHRSPLFVISPYVRHGLVEHGQFSTVAVLKTIEQLLGLDSMNYFDDRAPTLLGLFDKQPNLAPFNHIPARVRLDEKNSPNAPGAKKSASWDFSHPDSAPDQELNRVIWQSVKGSGSEPPAPVYSVHSWSWIRSQEQ